jgi:hypothetical protein
MGLFLSLVLVGYSKMPATSSNTIFTHRETSSLGPGREVGEAYAGTHPHHLTASRPVLTDLKVVGRREYQERYRKSAHVFDNQKRR